jgi:small multidrug resistance family-3 protein
MSASRASLRSRLADGKGAVVPKLALLGLLVLATVLESIGDAVVRMGLGQNGPLARAALFAAGAALLFGYGLTLNLAPLAFGRVVGLYIAVLFVVWQIINFVVFRSLPTLPILLGGALIVAGGSIVTFWQR